jgi:hypothetical protein
VGGALGHYGFESRWGHQVVLLSVLRLRVEDSGEADSNTESDLPSKRSSTATFKVHLDGYNITDALAGKTPSPRREFKVVFAEQRARGMRAGR